MAYPEPEDLPSGPLYSSTYDTSDPTENKHSDITVLSELN